MNGPSQNLPADFHDTLAEIQEYGILNEPPETVDQRLKEALIQAATAAGERPMDAGKITDWTLAVIDKCKAAVHNEICDPKLTGLKPEYNNLMAKGLTTEGIASVGVAVNHALSLVSPIYAVSSVVIYLSIFLLKVGLNSWCRSPLPGGNK
jgi:hypothetical protein